MSILGGLLGGVASGTLGVIGDIYGANKAYKGQVETNSANAALAREQMSWQEIQNQKSMDFSERMALQQQQYETEMSNTSYQRAMADLKSAGLNPMLAYMQGGASTPNVSAPTGVTSAGAKAEMSNPSEGYKGLGRNASEAVRNALESVRVKKELDIADSSIQNTEALTQKYQSDTVLQGFQMEQIANQMELATAQASREASQEKLNVILGALHEAQTEGVLSDNERKKLLGGLYDLAADIVIPGANTAKGFIDSVTDLFPTEFKQQIGNQPFIPWPLRSLLRSGSTSNLPFFEYYKKRFNKGD